MSELSWAAVVRLVHERARGCCEYCQTCHEIIGQTMHVDHIDPNGGDQPDNLCLACANCNLIKSKATTANDPETNQIVPLFNPRMQRWSEHFMWIDNAQRVLGLTPIGRATVERLRINQDSMVIARSLWVKAGYHPPIFDD